MKTKQIILSSIAFFTLFGMLWAGNEYVAKQKDLTQLSESFAAWKLEDKQDAVQKRIWYLEDRYKCPNCPDQITEYRQLLKELECIKEKLKGYYQKGRG